MFNRRALQPLFEDDSEMYLRIVASRLRIARDNSEASFLR